ncbi:hypothetical protein [Haloarcula sp. JP-L23]|uniref:hypothetical protein n=1 Tax=Haloarcula sp. JP-L23 TaxID=2716717 RepID=UPI00140F16E4|nr:hypothetical protein G9465_25105 [Haloarcula sp. JP-L23]
MADTAEPPEDRRSRIVAKIGLNEHDVLTTSEIAAEFPEKRPKTIRRNLHWMREQGLISGRRTTDQANSATWLWWVAVDDGAAEQLSAGEGVAAASQIGTLLHQLYYGRWEFKMIAAGVFITPLLFSATIWGVTLSELSIIDLGLTEILAIVAGGFLIFFILNLLGYSSSQLRHWGTGRLL